MPQQQLAEEFARVLARYRSIHNLYRETGVSQESLRRLERGRRPRVDIVENFARAIGEDVNKWRVLADYPAVHLAARPPVTYHPEAGAEPEAYGGPESLADLPPEEREELRRIWVAMIRAKREKLGLPVEE